MEEIFEKIRAHIKAKKIKQTWISQQSGLDRPHLSRILNCHQAPTLQTFCAILNAIGMKIDVLPNDFNVIPEKAITKQVHTPADVEDDASVTAYI